MIQAIYNNRTYFDLWLKLAFYSAVFCFLTNIYLLVYLQSSQKRKSYVQQILRKSKSTQRAPLEFA